MHHFDVWKDKLIELNEERIPTIETQVPKWDMKWTLEKYIKLQGGCIIGDMKKKSKVIKNESMAADVQKLWLVAKKYVTTTTKRNPTQRTRGMLVRTMVAILS